MGVLDLVRQISQGVNFMSLSDMSEPLASSF